MRKAKYLGVISLVRTKKSGYFAITERSGVMYKE